MVHSVLGIVDVLVDNESRGACVLVGPNANLANRAILAEDFAFDEMLNGKFLMYSH